MKIKSKPQDKNYSKCPWWGVNNPYADDMESYPNIKKLFVSNDKTERYWINECWNIINKEIGFWADNLDYIQILENYIKEVK
jgi:hypothetical protein